MNWTAVLIISLGALIFLSKKYDKEDDIVEYEVDELAELEAYIDSRDELIANIDNIYYSNVDATIEMYHNSKKELDNHAFVCVFLCLYRRSTSVVCRWEKRKCKRCIY